MSYTFVCYGCDGLIGCSEAEYRKQHAYCSVCLKEAMKQPLESPGAWSIGEYQRDPASGSLSSRIDEVRRLVRAGTGIPTGSIPFCSEPTESDPFAYKQKTHYYTRLRTTVCGIDVTDEWVKWSPVGVKDPAYITLVKRICEECKALDWTVK